MIPDDGRKWGKDKITVTLTRRQWIAILCELLPFSAWTKLFPDYFTREEMIRAAKSIEKRIPEIKATQQAEKEKNNG